MEDREMLEYAAKAAGIELDWNVPANSPPWRMTGTKGTDDYGPAHQWDPRTDDGDALRLMVKLGLSVEVGPLFVHVYFDHRLEAVEKIVGDCYAATRLAIVRAASRFGKAMP